jgi:hypothetical protein
MGKKIIYWASVITAVGIFLGAICYGGDLLWEKKDAANLKEQQCISRNNATNADVIELKGDMKAMIADIRNIDKTLEKIERKLP